MTIGRRIALGGAAVWLGRSVTILSGLVLLPILFRQLPKEELGLWLLMGQSWAAMGILDFGIGAALSRRIAFAKAASGSDPACALNAQSRAEIAHLVACGRLMYRVLAVSVFVVAWVLGFVYLRTLPLESVSQERIWLAWTILCACQALNVWSTVWICLLEGVGYVGWESLIATTVSVGTVAIQIATVMTGGGLVALAAAAAAGAVMQRLFLRQLARRRRPEIVDTPGHWSADTGRSLLRVALSAWLTMLGGVLVQNTDSLFIASALGATSVPAYRAAFLVVLNLNMLAGVFGAASAPYVSHLWHAGEFDEVRRVVLRNLRIGLGIIVAGVAVILSAGDSLFNAWLGSGNYAGWPLLALLSAMFFLELQTALIMTGCRATEHEVFARWTLAGGVLKLVLAYALTRRFGVIGVPLGTIAAQLLTAYWYVPYRGLARLGIGWRSYVTSVLAPCGALFVAALAISSLASRVAMPLGDWPRLLAVSAASGLVLCAALWFLVLGRGHRAEVGMVATG